MKLRYICCLHSDCLHLGLRAFLAQLINTPQNEAWSQSSSQHKCAS